MYFQMKFALVLIIGGCIVTLFAIATGWACGWDTPPGSKQMTVRRERLIAWVTAAQAGAAKWN